MTLQALTKLFPWSYFSKKVILRIDTPYCGGVFSEKDAEERELHLAKGSFGSIEDANLILISWLVDKQDGVIIDARFQVFGNTVLIACCEAACELVIGKNYDQARRMHTDLIEKHLRDKNDTPAFLEEGMSSLRYVVEAIKEASKSCEGIPLQENYIAPPLMGHSVDVVEGGWPGFSDLPLKQKLQVIEQVLNEEVRPFIEMDAGGVEVINLIEGKEVVIAYQGSCTSCHSATGATLSYIQQVLRAKVDPAITVTPV